MPWVPLRRSVNGLRLQVLLRVLRTPLGQRVAPAVLRQIRGGLDVVAVGRVLIACGTTRYDVDSELMVPASVLEVLEREVREVSVFPEQFDRELT